jgi:hypothetical protein
MKKEKNFDCLKMKAEIQAKVYEEVKGMNFQELRAYYDKKLENCSFWHRQSMKTEIM